jgi:RNA polymerase sigma-70 factor, ECF subfamily
MTEKELIKGCLLKDERCQEMLYKKYYPDMLRVCMQYSHSREEAMDILNRGFLKAFHSLSSYKGQGPLGAWIRRIMVNAAIDYYRRQMQIVPAEANIDELQIEIDPDIYGKIGVEEILMLLKSIPRHQQIVFNLYALEGYSHTEIGQLLQISESTSRWHLMEARKLLRQKLDNLLQTKKNDRHEQFFT